MASLKEGGKGLGSGNLGSPAMDGSVLSALNRGATTFLLTHVLFIKVISIMPSKEAISHNIVAYYLLQPPSSDFVSALYQLNLSMVMGVALTGNSTFLSL